MSQLGEGLGIESTLNPFIGVAEPTPEQWADEHRAKELPPDKRLLWAILDDAIRCYVEHGGGTKHRRKALFREAAYWLFTIRPAHVTFKYVCQELDINPGYLRKRLIATRRSGIRKLPVASNVNRGTKKMGGYWLAD